MGMGTIIIIVIVTLALLGGLVYFFVEVEVDEDEMLEGTEEAHQDTEEEEDPYAWAKESESIEDTLSLIHI